jgi:hypothetical protein
MGRACSVDGENTNACRTLVKKSEGKIPLPKPRSTRVNNIKMDLREIRRGGLAQDRNQ